MPSGHDSALRQAVETVMTSEAPVFGSIYRRVAQRSWLVRLGGTVAGAALLWVVVGLQPPAPPAFDHQVAAFVTLVWED